VAAVLVPRHLHPVRAVAAVDRVGAVDLVVGNLVEQVAAEQEQVAAEQEQVAAEQEQAVAEQAAVEQAAVERVVVVLAAVVLAAVVPAAVVPAAVVPAAAQVLFQSPQRVSCSRSDVECGGFGVGAGHLSNLKVLGDRSSRFGSMLKDNLWAPSVKITAALQSPLGGGTTSFAMRRLLPLQMARRGDLGSTCESTFA
jgi:hypothetical protein